MYEIDYDKIIEIIAEDLSIDVKSIPQIKLNLCKYDLNRYFDSIDSYSDETPDCSFCNRLDEEREDGIEDGIDKCFNTLKDGILEELNHGDFENLIKAPNADELITEFLTNLRAEI